MQRSFKALIASLTTLCLIQLTSCGPQITRDGPPARDIDPATVPNAIPKIENTSSHGNAKYYQVNGKTYKVLKNSKHYSKTGIASWYGTRFEGQYTSTRERYHMFGMTAASPELPLPTYVKVTNLENGRDVVVKVNDRGPFEKNRLLDLSYVAAKKLGFSGQGTALVRVTAINPATWRTETAAVRNITYQQGHHLYIQVGAFSNKQNAQRARFQIVDIAKTSKVYLGKSSAHHKSLYRVEIGPITTLAENNRIYNVLTNKGYTVIPIRR